MNRVPRISWCLLLIVGFCSAGCGSNEIEGFEHLELLPPTMELPEFSLGSYVIPVPGDLDEPARHAHRNRMQLEFTLFAETTPENVEHLKAAMEHSEGQIRDQIIRTCRKASFGDLEEANLVTLKTQMLDAIRPFVGPDRIRRLIVSDFQKNEL